MAEHVYMFAGKSDHVVLQTTPGMAGELIDWFGNGVRFTNETNNSVLAHVTVNFEAMRYWALQYAPYVTVLEPEALVEKLRDDLENALVKYCQNKMSLYA